MYMYIYIMYIYIYNIYIYMYYHVLYATYSSAQPYLHRRLPGPDLHFDIRQLKLFGHSIRQRLQGWNGLDLPGQALDAQNRRKNQTESHDDSI